MLVETSDTTRARASNRTDSAVTPPSAPALDFTTAVDFPVDYSETAQVADTAFAEPGKFSPGSLQWLYERCFSLGSTVVSLRSGARKVGQFVILKQKLVQNGRIIDAAQLVDLMVLPEFRSRRSLTALYGAVEQQCQSDGIAYAIGMPNQKAISANEHFIGLKPNLWLDIRAGIASPFARRKLKHSARFANDDRAALAALFADYEPPLSEQGLVWTAEMLVSRLDRPSYEYGVHATEDVLLISSPRTRKGIPYTLMCAFFPKAGQSPSAADMRAVVADACTMWGRPLYVYPGMQKSIQHTPGWLLPMWLRPSTMLVQVRQFDMARPPIAFDRYQSIDFDFG